MMEPGETTDVAPKGQAKTLRQKDRFRTKLWKAYAHPRSNPQMRRISQVYRQRQQKAGLSEDARSFQTFSDFFALGTVVE